MKAVLPPTGVFSATINAKRHALFEGQLLTSSWRSSLLIYFDIMIATPINAILSSLGPIGAASLLLWALLVGYVSYMRFFHPLARYPGPALASLTNIWKAYYVYRLEFHEKLVDLHKKYGPVVRIGPNHLHFWNGEAIATIYKGGRKMGKTEFYDAFTAFNPNLFGGTDEDVGI